MERVNKHTKRCKHRWSRGNVNENHSAIIPRAYYRAELKKKKDISTMGKNIEELAL